MSIQRLGTGLIRHEGTTLDIKLDEMDSKDNQYAQDIAELQAGTPLDIFHGANASAWASRKPQRLVNKQIAVDTSRSYDHFGTMAMKADGTLYQVFRRGIHHTDRGDTMYSELLPSGSWSTPRILITDSTLDVRGQACGTAPDGNIYVFGTKATPQPRTGGLQVFSDTVVYKSTDNGATFSLIATIPKPLTGDNALMQTFGKMVVVGNRLMVPAYGRDNAFTGFLSYLYSDDNGVTWSKGVNLASGVDYNEASILDLGGGTVICVARTGSGKVGASNANNLRQFISSDGGNTWTNQGYITAADSASDLDWYLITPALSLVYSNGGTPYVLLTYTRRREAVRYRLATVASVTAGVAGWSVSRVAINLMTPESFESGYQTQEVVNGMVLMNVYYTTVPNTSNESDPAPISNARQFQMPLGDLPDFESAWTATTQNVNWTVNHSLGCIPRKVELVYCADTLGANEYPVDNMSYYNGTTTVGAGVAWQCNLSGFTIRPGTYLMFQGVFGTGGINPTTGYIKIRAWK